jgi:hypothetical protein
VPEKPRTPTRADIAAAQKAVGGVAELLSLEEHQERHAEAMEHLRPLLATIRRLIPFPEVQQLLGLIRGDAGLVFRGRGPRGGRARGDFRTQYLRDCARLRTHIGVSSVSPRKRR